MKTNVYLITTLAMVCSLQAEARRGGQDNGARPETISCGLLFDGNPQLQASQSVLVQNAQAVLRGEAQGVSYVFSVRGKTAVARLIDGTQVVTAQGAIEMLRHGGEDRGNAGAPTVLRRGEDDANDGTPEREAGLQLSLAAVQTPARPKVSLKCESVNQTQKSQGELL